MVIKKHSRKREAILNKFLSANCHPTADWVYREMKVEFPDISLDTIYRNIRLFKQEGIITSLGIINGQEHFELNYRHHGHFICKLCGGVEDIEITDEMAAYLDESVNIPSAQVDKIDLNVHGTCIKCL